MTTANFCVDIYVGTTAAPDGCWTSCLGGIVGSCTPCVFVVGLPVLFVRALISFTYPRLTCPVACEPAVAIFKPGFTRASPPDGGPPIRVVAAFTTRQSNAVSLALALSLF